jgi:hypothetical protein
LAAARIAQRTGAAARRRPLARSRGVPRFVVLHLPHDGARALVAGRQGIEMPFEMLLDLSFGLDDETEARRIADASGDEPMAKAPAYHSGLSRLGLAPSSSSRCWVQARWSSLPAPLHRNALQALVSCGQRLRLVERLRAHLANVIDAHQPLAWRRWPRRAAHLPRWPAPARPRRMAGAGHGPKRVVGGNQEAIEHVASGGGAGWSE